MKDSLDLLKKRSIQAGLNYVIHFGIRRFFLDGSSVSLTTNDDWNRLIDYNILHEEIKLHYKKELSLVIKDDFKYFIKADSLSNTPFLKKLSELGMGNSVAIYRKNTDYINAYFFTIESFIPSAVQLLVNKITTFEKMVDEAEGVKIESDISKSSDLKQWFSYGDLQQLKKCKDMNGFLSNDIESRKEFAIFTKSELKVLRLFINTTVTKEISERLALSPRTVEEYIRNIKRKSNKHSRTLLSIMARKMFKGEGGL